MVNGTDDPFMAWQPTTAGFPFSWSLDNLELPFNSPPVFDLSSTSHSPIRVSNVTRSIDRVDPHSQAACQDHGATEPHRASPRRYLEAENICGGYTKPCGIFPDVEPDDLQVAEAEMFGHISLVPAAAVKGLHKFYLTQQTGRSMTPIPKCVLRAFLELYFEHFDRQFPCIHPSRVEDPSLSWILLLATTAVGSHYSEMTAAAAYNTILCDLLARAVESAFLRSLKADISLMQSTFLLHVIWMFSGSGRDKVLVQHKRGSLAAMCWDLLGQVDPPQDSDATSLGLEQIWEAWLAEEETIRLVTSVRALESLDSVFLDTPLISSLRTLPRRLPSSESLWRCRNTAEWQSTRQELGKFRHTTAGDSRSQPILQTGDFGLKILHLELFTDQKSLARHIKASQAMKVSFATSLGFPTPTPTQTSISQVRPSAESRGASHPLLETLPEHPAFSMFTDMLYEPPRQSDTILEVLAILHHVSLETLHSATGWQATKEQMFRAKSRFRDFFQNDGIQARRCLLHAARIFRVTRGSRLGACYDVFSVMIAMGFIYCYIELCTETPHTEKTSGHQRVPLVRLDQLESRVAVDNWINNGADSLLHLTGVGLLSGPDACVRFLRDIEKSLLSQIAWAGICRAFAGSFAQLRRGETPTRPSTDHI
ncbi:uncharacterized protein B0I36DRAFT_368606 [Microdochium trichocladiopsis]|uniref:Xylanolytic transcriptional activator regulatory domain-containing protein n=1 Tax=Microdochium trichocladiopsis TaxID=1682393 RepID=A0A9P9BK00_9PEZI|nr:uncharacterized protein B0I36DRAFT_368606 [Microdochium trichocladiopsis]KAH7018600.1 hypothetical protein B0I36DRAFT_368606 [Microdochium trichocladiopsis]